MEERAAHMAAFIEASRKRCNVPPSDSVLGRDAFFRRRAVGPARKDVACPMQGQDKR
jgi:hypothetical protein